MAELGPRQKALLKRVEELAPWGQQIDLGLDIRTGGSLLTVERLGMVVNLLPRDLSDLTVLDVGCNSGYFSVEVKKLGARYVRGIDFPKYVDQARFLAEHHGVEVEFRAQSLYRLDPAETFDITLMMGLLYHLKHPFLALDILSRVTTRMILIETEVLAESAQADLMRFVEHTYRRDPTTWWIPGENVVLGMLRACGFDYVHAYPFEHPAFRENYREGVTEEGLPKGKRIFAVGLKGPDFSRFTHITPEIADLAAESVSEPDVE